MSYSEIRRMQPLAGIITEIKINKPARNWDFTQYIPNFNPKDISVGDRITTKECKESPIIDIEIIQDDAGDDELLFSTGKNYGFDEEMLVQINIKNKKGLNEIKINNPNKPVVYIDDDNGWERPSIKINGKTYFGYFDAEGGLSATEQITFQEDDYRNDWENITNYFKTVGELSFANYGPEEDHYWVKIIPIEDIELSNLV